MSISELLKKVEASAKKRNKAERLALLIEANILDESGNYDSLFFSAKTVQNGQVKVKKRKLNIFG